MREEGILPAKRIYRGFQQASSEAFGQLGISQELIRREHHKRKSPGGFRLRRGWRGARLGAAFVLSHSPFTAGNKEHLILTRVEPG
jgi:hypothetical protein